MKSSVFEPRELGFPKDKREIYKHLTTDKASPFYGKPLRDVFMSAFAIGYANQTHKPFKNRAPDIRFESVSQKEKWILISVAIKENKDISILLDEKGQKSIWTTAEEYANGGIDLLHSLVFESAYSGSASKKLETDVRQHLKKIKF